MLKCDEEILQKTETVITDDVIKTDNNEYFISIPNYFPEFRSCLCKNLTIKPSDSIYDYVSLLIRFFNFNRAIVRGKKYQ